MGPEVWRLPGSSLFGWGYKSAGPYSGMVYIGYIRIPDYGSALRANGFDPGFNIPRRRPRLTG